MKRIMLVLVFVVLGLFTVEAGAAKDTGKTDDIQTRYIGRLKTINHDLLELLKNLKMNYINSESQQKLELLEAKYRSSVPLDVQMKGKELEREQLRINSKTSELEKNRDDLELDALKYYKGKMPKWLNGEWNKEMTKYLDAQTVELNAMKNRLDKQN